MKFFVDTADITAIRDLKELGMVEGATTNPSLILKSGRDVFDVTKELCETVPGPVSIQVMAIDAKAMIEEGLKLAKIAPNIAINVPMTWEGLTACRAFASEGQMVNVTFCFTVNQALLAAKAGATFVSPFIAQLEDESMDGMQLIKNIRTVYENYDMKTEILAASIRSVNHISECARNGADVVTAPPEVIKAMVQHPLTDEQLGQSMSDWEKTGQQIA
ncbi:fructose-6-phosphate aldolase [Rhodobacteraceae bacterium]|nr:fructose-6-phosphate aldolase [Paracoccaceae bacterium]